MEQETLGSYETILREHFRRSTTRMTDYNHNRLREELSEVIDALEQHPAVSDVMLQAAAEHDHAELIIEYDSNLTTRRNLIQLTKEHTNHEVESFDEPLIPLHLVIYGRQPEPEAETDE